MNSTPQLYVTADLIRNTTLAQKLQQRQQRQQPEQLPSTDVFEIPDLPFITPNIDANANYIKSINHKAMTQVMNEVANQRQKTPSITTKQTDVSIQVPKQPTSTTQVETTSVKKNTSKNTFNKKVIVEDEDKESAIDYDDDDPEIKKTKLSLFQFTKDITFNLIFAIPFLQKARLNAMLREPNLAINQIERIFDEFKDRLSQFELESLKKYVCEDGIRDQLNYILETGFNKILSDGVIDINDAPQFNQLVYYIIKSFNEINNGKVYRFYVSREHVMLLLHFVLKSVFTLTLKGQEEQMAIGLLDTSFKLVQLDVLPIISKRWYHKFRICNSAKRIEDIID
ncbi:MAG: hypothetical protein EBU66_08740 [Bacteroidetes bacterium]|nr:hypothetical protein [bacterium]NBP64735.1 hypothetical protein [Bacteroidota bacterium]